MVAFVNIFVVYRWTGGFRWGGHTGAVGGASSVSELCWRNEASGGNGAFDRGTAEYTFSFISMPTQDGTAIYTYPIVEDHWTNGT